MMLADYMGCPKGLGYTQWAELNCSTTVRRGRELDRKRKVYDRTYNNVSAKLESLKKSGVNQQRFENLSVEFDRLLTEKQTLENTLKVETTLTKAVIKSPELYYQEYKDNGGKLGWGWFKKFVGSVASVVTAGNSCNGAEDEFKEDQRNHNNSLKRLKLKEGEYKALQEIEKKITNYSQAKIPVINKTIAKLKQDIAEQKQKRNAVMVSYENKKRAEELALRQKAEQEAKNKQLATTKMSPKTAGVDLGNNKVLLGVAVVGVCAFMYLNKKDSKKPKK